MARDASLTTRETQKTPQQVLQQERRRLGWKCCETFVSTSWLQAGSMADHGAGLQPVRLFRTSSDIIVPSIVHKARVTSQRWKHARKSKDMHKQAKHHVDLSVSGSDPTVAYNLVVSSQCSEHHRDNEIAVFLKQLEYSSAGEHGFTCAHRSHSVLQYSFALFTVDHSA